MTLASPIDNEMIMNSYKEICIVQRNKKSKFIYSIIISLH